MPTATAWRRRFDSTPRRGSSPTRPAADSIERLSPDLYPSTPPSVHTPSRIKREANGHALQGLGLSHTALSDRLVADPDHLFLDANGRAHLGAKLRSPKHDSSSRTHTSRAPTAQYRGPPKRSHARTASTMSIDDLANIAIATSPQFVNSNQSFSFNGSPIFHAASRPSTSYINGYSQDAFDRPAKRIKSERLYSAEWSQPDDRPRSSYTYQSEVRKEDAELLLGLQNGFSFKAAAASRSLHPSASESAQQLPSRKLLTSRDQLPAIEEKQIDPTTDPQHTADPVSSPADKDLSHLPKVQPASVHHDPQHVKEPLQSLQHEEQEIDAEVDEQEKEPYIPTIQAATGTAEQEAQSDPLPLPEPAKKSRRVQVETTQPVCPTCNQINSNAREGESTIDWIKCEGSCNRWFHIPCAGFTDQQVKKVAKFICKDCEPEHGQTTFARTSSRARAAPDYAALNEGLTQNNEDATMHHFVPKFKDGSIHYFADTFARIRPELLTKELWENFDGMKRPFVVPALWNPRFGQPQSDDMHDDEDMMENDDANEYITYTTDGHTIQESKETDSTTTLQRSLQEEVIDLDQDYLDMVMPRDLTVRKVAELYGPEEPVPVIDVKSQGIKGKFTLRQWANYYEEKGIKPIRNVISLEVSHSRLGRLIRRPKVVRDIDLEDQVWDAESRANTKKRPVAFYCLMSVGDSYTDFHIDFGGSSVYYHILKGRKTFFFIPPEERYLKKYEEWNMNPEQNQIWLGDHCDGNVTRVDLFPGDTAFIPAGWIHSVWTPEDSLVIGGNFLTRYDLDMQLKVVNIEKINNTPLNFRYPAFQKVMWYTLIKYLEDDPVPENVIRDFEDDPDYRYMRALPVWHVDEIAATDVEPEEEDYNARNYSKSELHGLPALRDFLYRTARIYADLPVGNINKKQIDAVKASIPKGHGDPLQLICLFAVWIAWKRGNERAPDWVHSDAMLQQELDKRDKEKVKKPEVFRVPPERVSARRKNQSSNSPAPDRQDTPDTDTASVTNEPSLPYPRIACAACRKKRQTCRHGPSAKLEETAQQTLEKTRSYSNVTIDIAKLARASTVVNSIEGPAAAPQPAPPVVPVTPVASIAPTVPVAPPQAIVDENTQEIPSTTNLAQEALARMSSQPPESNSATTVNGTTPTPGSAKKGRSKACDECRKSKRRCVHDEHGRVDPAKAAEPSKPRGSNSSKRPRLSDEHQSKKVKVEDDYAVYLPTNDFDAMIDPALMDPMLGIQYPDSTTIISDVNALSTPPRTMTAQNSMMTPGPFEESIDPNIDPALMDPALLESSQEGGMTDDMHKLLPSALPKLSTAAVGTPDMDKSFSPITAEDASADAVSKRPSEEKQPAQGSSSDLPDAAERPHINGVPHVQRDVATDGHQTRAASSPPAATAVSQTPASIEKTQSGSVPMPRSTDVDSSNDSMAVKQPDIVTSHEPVNNKVKHENQAVPSAQGFSRADTAVSSTSDPEEDASERLARELQAQEHGLRRRPSVRIS